MGDGQTATWIATSNSSAISLSRRPTLRSLPNQSERPWCNPAVTVSAISHPGCRSAPPAEPPDTAGGGDRAPRGSSGRAHGALRGRSRAAPRGHGSTGRCQVRGAAGAAASGPRAAAQPARRGPRPEGSRETHREVLIHDDHELPRRDRSVEVRFGDKPTGQHRVDGAGGGQRVGEVVRQVAGREPEQDLAPLGRDARVTGPVLPAEVLEQLLTPGHPRHSACLDATRHRFALGPAPSIERDRTRTAPSGGQSTRDNCATWPVPAALVSNPHAQKPLLSRGFLSGRDRRRSGDLPLFRRTLCQLSYPTGRRARAQPFGPGPANDPGSGPDEI